MNDLVRMPQPDARPRVDGALAYVLHTRPFKETSLLVEAFARDHGRIALVARGARRPRSHLAGLIRPFQPLLLSWYGSAELRTLHGAEWQGGVPPMMNEALVCGFYANELILKLVPREDPHPALFAIYERSLTELAGAGRTTQPAVLRRFEVGLLAETGYGVELKREVDTGQPVESDVLYRYVLERGPVRSGTGAGIPVLGRTLRALDAGEFSDATTMVEARELMRAIINHHLEGERLFSRQLLLDLQEL